MVGAASVPSLAEEGTRVHAARAPSRRTALAGVCMSEFVFIVLDSDYKLQSIESFYSTHLAQKTQT